MSSSVRDVARAAPGVVERLRKMRIVPVIVIEDPADARPLAAALSQAGLPCAEITFRTAGAAEALRRIAGEFPDMLVGAGTVLNIKQAEDARRAGARFIVSPGFNPAVVDHCQEQEIPIYPGVCTPTEIDAALEKGLTTLKFFPAELRGGVSFLKAIAAPYSIVEFMPTGGIGLVKLPEYLVLSNVLACGGSWMAPAEWIKTRQFDHIRQETERAVRAARNLTEERSCRR